MDFQISQPSSEYINSRLDAFLKIGNADLRTDLRWMSSVKYLITTKEMAQRHLTRFINYQVIVSFMNDNLLAAEIQSILNDSVPWFQRFNEKAYNSLDLTPAIVTACNSALQNMIPNMSRIQDEEILTALSEDARELYYRVSVNGMLQGKKSGGILGLLRPKAEMRSDVKELVEHLAGIQSALATSANQVLKAQAPSN